MALTRNRERKGWVYRVKMHSEHLPPVWRFFCAECFMATGRGIHTSTSTWELAYRDAHNHMRAHRA